MRTVTAMGVCRFSSTSYHPASGRSTRWTALKPSFHGSYAICVDKLILDSSSIRTRPSGDASDVILTGSFDNVSRFPFKPIVAPGSLSARSGPVLFTCRKVHLALLKGFMSLGMRKFRTSLLWMEDGSRGMTAQLSLTVPEILIMSSSPLLNPRIQPSTTHSPPPPHKNSPSR